MTQTTPLRVAYLGPPASFSHQAARDAFSRFPSVIHQPLPSFAAIFLAIQNGSHQLQENGTSDPPPDFAVLPIENSTNGGVVQVLDLFTQCRLDPECSYPDIEVVAEHYLEVHHNLFVHPSALSSDSAKDHSNDESSSSPAFDLSKFNITNIYTHPQVWGQCGNFLSQDFPPSQTERTDVSSTSAAALLVAQNPPLPSSSETKPDPNNGTIAAISSSLAGQQNNLVCIASNIEDEPGKNTTRFLIIHNRKHTPSSPLSTQTYLSLTQTQPPHHHHQPPSSSTITITKSTPPTPKETYLKTLLTFTIPHTKPGSLASVLSIFSKHNSNLTTITTRPSRLSNWHYVFFVECENLLTRSTLREFLDQDEEFRGLKMEVEGETERFAVLGTWVDGER